MHVGSKYLGSLWVVWLSVGDDSNDIRHVAAVTCRWLQHNCTNIGERGIRVGSASRILDWGDGCLYRWYGAICIQVKCKADSWRVRDETNARITAVDIQPANKLRQKRFDEFEICWTDASGFVQNEDDVGRTM